jgi:hypothetical protein
MTMSLAMKYTCGLSSMSETSSSITWEPIIKPIHCLAAAAIFLLAGCRSNTPPSTPQAWVRRQVSAKLHSGMTEAEVAQVLGQPKEYRPGNGKRDDVAIYRLEDQTFTLYFYQNRLTRYVSSQQPVNR